MAYCTLDNLKSNVLETTLIQLSNDNIGGDITSATIDETVINSCISSADAYIDGKLRGRYILPLPSVPQELTNISICLSKYYLYKRRFQTKVPSGVYDEFKDADKQLREIQKGVISLGIEGSAEPTKGQYRSNKTEKDRLFPDSFLNRF